MLYFECFLVLKSLFMCVGYFLTIILIVFIGSMSTASHQVLVFPPFGFFFYLFELLFLFCFITGVYINTFFWY